MNNDYNFWFWLSVLADFAQLDSYNILLQDFDNNDLMFFLEHEDNLLNKIINQNEQIITLLKGGKKDARNKANDRKNSR